MPCLSSTFYSLSKPFPSFQYTMSSRSSVEGSQTTVREVDGKALDAIKILLDRSPNPSGISKHDCPSQITVHSSTSTRSSTTIVAADYPHGLKLGIIVFALTLASFLMALDMMIVATAIPQITADFHSLDQVNWYGSAFFLTLASFQCTWGKFYTFFPLKSSFLGAIGVFEIGSLICGTAQNSPMLVVGRAIAGTKPQTLSIMCVS